MTFATYQHINLHEMHCKFINIFLSNKKSFQWPSFEVFNSEDNVLRFLSASTNRQTVPTDCFLFFMRIVKVAKIFARNLILEAQNFMFLVVIVVFFSCFEKALALDKEICGDISRKERSPYNRYVRVFWRRYMRILCGRIKSNHRPLQLRYIKKPSRTLETTYKSCKKLHPETHR